MLRKAGIKQGEKRNKVDRLTAGIAGNFECRTNHTVVKGSERHCEGRTRTRGCHEIN